MTKATRGHDATNDGRASAFVRTSAAAGVVTFAALMTAFTGGAASAATTHESGTVAVSVANVASLSAATPPVAPPPQGSPDGGASAPGTDYVPDTGLSNESPTSPAVLPADSPAVDPADPADPAQAADGLAVTGSDAALIAGLAGAFIAGGALITIAGSAARRRTARAKD